MQLFDWRWHKSSSEPLRGSVSRDFKRGNKAWEEFEGCRDRGQFDDLLVVEMLFDGRVGCIVNCVCSKCAACRHNGNRIFPSR